MEFYSGKFNETAEVKSWKLKGNNTKIFKGMLTRGERHEEF